MPIDIICGKGAFESPNIHTLILTKGVTGALQSEFWNSFRDSVKTLVINEGITIFNASFNDVVGLEYVELKDVLSIANWQFSGCEKLANVVAPNLVIIGEHAFDGCLSLRSLDAPSLLSCGGGAFLRCWNLSEICGAAVFVTGGMIFRIIDGDSASMIQPIDNEMEYLSLFDVTAPSGKTYKVTQIGEEACCDMKNLKGLYLPDHFESLGGYAFKGCKNLLTIKVPITLDCCYGAERPTFKDVRAGLLLLTIGNGNGPIYPFWDQWKSCLMSLMVYGGIREFDYLFADYDRLEMVGLESVEHIKKSQFESCDVLERVSIPSARYIDKYAFKDCGNLISLEANFIYSIGYKAFYDCESLQGFIHTAVKKIGERAFYNCMSLKKFSFYGIESIGERSFWNTQVKKPDDLGTSVKIDKKAFGKTNWAYIKWAIGFGVGALILGTLGFILLKCGLVILSGIALWATVGALAVAFVFVNWDSVELLGS